MRKLDLEQNSPEWEQFRRTHIGASDSPIICGVSPFNTAYKLWREKVIGEKGPSNRAMEEGHALESYARKWAESVYMTSYPPICILHDQLPFPMASLDGYSEEYNTILEIKVVGDNTFYNAETNGPPLHWVYQVNHQMECAGVNRTLIFMMHRSKEKYCSFAVDRDPAIVSEILEKGDAFYARMANFDPPDDTHQDREDEEWKEAAQRFLEAKSILDEAEEDLSVCRSRLIDISGDVSCRGFGVKATKYTSRGSVDYGKIPELKTLDLAAYRKPSKESWRIA